MNDELMIVSRLEAKPSFEATLEDELKALAVATRNEPGCLQYIVNRDINNSTVFILVQRWISKEELEMHFLTPHFIQHSLILATLITAPPIISYLETIDE